MSRNGSTKQKTRIIIDSKQQISGGIPGAQLSLEAQNASEPSVSLMISSGCPKSVRGVTSSLYLWGNYRGWFGLPYPSNDCAKCWVYHGFPMVSPIQSTVGTSDDIWSSRFSARGRFCCGKAPSHCMVGFLLATKIASPMRSGMEHPKKKYGVGLKIILCQPTMFDMLTRKSQQSSMS